VHSVITFVSQTIISIVLFIEVHALAFCLYFSSDGQNLTEMLSTDSLNNFYSHVNFN